MAAPEDVTPSRGAAPLLPTQAPGGGDNNTCRALLSRTLDSYLSQVWNQPGETLPGSSWRR